MRRGQWRRSVCKSGIPFPSLSCPSFLFSSLPSLNTAVSSQRVGAAVGTDRQKFYCVFWSEKSCLWWHKINNQPLICVKTNSELECTHRMRTYAVLLLSVSPPSECEKAIVARNEVLSCSATNWPCDLDLWHLNTKTVSLLVYPNVISYTNFEHFGIIRFLSYAINWQTDGLENPTYADRHRQRG